MKNAHHEQLSIICQENIPGIQRKSKLVKAAEKRHLCVREAYINSSWMLSIKNTIILPPAKNIYLGGNNFIEPQERRQRQQRPLSVPDYFSIVRQVKLEARRTDFAAGRELVAANGGRESARAPPTLKYEDQYDTAPHPLWCTQTSTMPRSPQYFRW